MTKWYLIHNGQQVGPLSTQEVKQLAHSDKLQPYDLLKKGEKGQPIRADKVKGLFKTENTSQRTPATPPPLPQMLIVPEPPVAAPPPFVESPALPPPGHSRSTWSFWIMALGVVGLIGFCGIAFILILILSGDSASNSTVNVVSRINLRWSDGTPQLYPLMQNYTEEQRALLGFSALVSGVDIYAANIRLTNTGNIPVRVSPGNIRIHFGGEVTPVYTMNDFRFLQPSTLQPGESVTGLATYPARIDIGRAIRLGNGKMSYEDPSLQVTYE